MKTSQQSVLFVCMGNICRSPTGEGVFRALVEREGCADAIAVDSAGTISYHRGEHPDSRMRHAASKRGYRLESRARQIRREDLDIFDLIIAMDSENLGDIRSLLRKGEPGEHIRLLSAFLPDGHPVDVPDPYYGGADGFDLVIDMIEEACPRILEHLRGEVS